MPDAAVRDGLIFIVDDDEGVRSSLRLLVRSLGLRARAFPSGEAFLDEFDGREGVCVLLDVRMPGISGFEVRQRLTAMNFDIPVIFLTAQGEEEIPESIGSVERVQKPFRDDYLVNRILELTGASSE